MTDATLAAPIKFGRFMFDLQDERLIGPDGPVRLGNKAYRVLRALIEQNGRLLTKDDLFASVWDGTTVSEASLTSVVKELRRALGDEAREPRYIASVYGRGYRFIADTVPGARNPPPAGAIMPAAAAPPLQGRRGEPPTLAVLPFSNRSGLPEDDVFAGGMVEDVIAALSQSANLTVLGSTVTEGLRRGAITDLAALGQRLGVRYLLEGNVRRLGGKLRVTTQILEAASGAVRWSARFDRPLSELAELQEALVLDLAASLDVQVQGLELQRILKKPHDLTAWEALMRSNAFYHKLDAPNLMRALAEAERAVAIAPDYGAAHAQTALAAAVVYLLTSPDDPAEEARIAARIDRALALEPDDVLVLGATGCAYNYIGRPDEGYRHLMRAVQKQPGHGLAHYHLGVANCLLDRHAAAIAHLETASRLFTGSTLLYLTIAWQAGSLIRSGRWEEGEAAFDATLSLSPEFWLARVQKAVCRLRDGDAAAAAALFRPFRTAPDYSQPQCETLLRRILGGTPAMETMIAGVRHLWDEAADRGSLAPQPRSWKKSSASTGSQPST